MLERRSGAKCSFSRRVHFGVAAMHPTLDDLRALRSGGENIRDVGGKSISTADIKYGDKTLLSVQVKIANWEQGAVWRAAPEYSDVARLAKHFGVPPRVIYNAALQAAQNARGKGEH